MPVVARPPPTSSLPQTDSLWDEALQKIPDADKALINTQHLTKTRILEEILSVAEDKRKICLGKRWKYKRGGQDVFIRDKLEKITTWIQRFKDAGSTIVQYDPVHAALPWAGVLLLLQITTGDIQCFGATVDGVERVASIIPRCSLLEDIYLRNPSSPARNELHLALVKLYVSILRYLIKALKFFGKPTASRVLVATLGGPEADVQRHLDIIAKKHADVDSCVLVVQSEAAAAADGSAENMLNLLTQLQRPIIRSAEQVAELHSQLGREERRRILQWLSSIPHHRHHRLESEDHLPRSGTWVLNHTHFQQWRESSTSAILWLHGIPGCGKTKLMYTVIHRLLEEHGSMVGQNAAPVAYFYCARNPAEPGRADPGELARCLLKQLAVTGDGSLRGSVVEAFRARERAAVERGSDIDMLTLEDTKVLMFQILERTPVTIMIDALDECDPSRRHLLLNLVDDILHNAASIVKIMVSSRDDGDICHRFEAVANLYVRASDNREDIERYIDVSLSNALASGRLLNGRMTGGLRNEVSATLKAGAQGMFRWVTMQIDNLCDGRRLKIESDVRQEVGELPRTLHEAYHRSYNRILSLARPSRVIAERVFKWLLCAQKLFNAEELAAAVIFPSESHILGARDMLDICCNLVVVDDLGHFRLAHLSVREYLESLPTYTAEECHSFALRRCLEAYLGDGGSWKRLRATHLDLSVKPYAMLFWPVHAQKIRNPRTDRSLWPVLAEFVFGDDSSCGSCGPPLRAIQHDGRVPSRAWADWISDAWNASHYSADLECDHALLQRLGSTVSTSSNPWFLACAFDFVWVLEAMKEYGWRNWTCEPRNYHGDTCIGVAVEWRSMEVLQWLLYSRSAANPNEFLSALVTALENGNFRAARALATHEFNGFAMTSGDTPKETAIYQATEAGDVVLVRGILSNTRFFEPTPFAESMWMAYRESRDFLFPLFWNTCTQLPGHNYFRSLLAIQKISLDKSQSLDSNDAVLVANLLQTLFDYARDSESFALNRICRVRALLGPEFQNLDTSPTRLFGLFPSLEYVRLLQRFLHNAEKLQTESREVVGTFEVMVTLASLGGMVDGLFNKVDAERLQENSEAWCLQQLVNIFSDDPIGHNSSDSDTTTSSDDTSTPDANSTFGNDASDEVDDVDACATGLLSLYTGLSRSIFGNGGNIDPRDSQGRTPLMVATGSRIPEVMGVLMECDADLTAKDHSGRSALGHAVLHNNANAVGALIQAGVDVNGQVAQNKTVLELSTDRCRHSMVARLRKAGARRPGVFKMPQEDKTIDFPFLAGQSCVTCVALLIQNSPDKDDEQNEADCVFRALAALGTGRNNVQPLAHTLQHGIAGSEDPSPTLIFTHATKESLERASSEDGLTPLQAAVALGAPDLVQELLKAGVDVNAVDHHGFSALHYAAVISYDSTCSLQEGSLRRLLDAKADPCQRDRMGRTPLHLASMVYGWRQSFKIQQLAGEMGSREAGVNAADAAGNVALHQAVSLALVEAIETLLQAGADINIKNEDGQTPLSMAKNNPHVLGLLRMYSAGPDQTLRMDEIDLGDLDSSEGERFLPPEIERARCGGDGEAEKGTTTASDADLQVHNDKERRRAHEPTMSTEVDWFSGYGEESWTALSGPRLLPLRPLSAIYWASS